MEVVFEIFEKIRPRVVITGQVDGFIFKLVGVVSHFIMNVIIEGIKLIIIKLTCLMQVLYCHRGYMGIPIDLQCKSIKIRLNLKGVWC